MTLAVLPDARARRAALQRVAEQTIDLLVVGGGITGVGVALDAVSRGLRVALIEAEDLAFGTSRWSSKLVHGGLRYLATGDLATARESARERHLLMTVIAPHLIRPLGQLVPFGRGVDARQRVGVATGMLMGDALRLRAGTPRAVLPPPRLVSRDTARRLAPRLDPAGLRGGMLGADGQLVDDARLVIAVARTAASLGAEVLTRVRARTLREDGASVEDGITGERFEVRARAVVNATGVWSGGLDAGLHVRPSRGTHLIVDAGALSDPPCALMVPHPGSISRFVFALPQQLGRVVIGLTDEDAPGPLPAVPRPEEAEVRFLLETVSRVLATPLARDDVIGSFAGLRPLVGIRDRGRTADISRRHLVTVSDAGFVSVLGGKLTTYRRMAEDAVDLAVRHRHLDAAPGATARLPLVGARGRSRAPAGILRRHGGEAAAVIAGARCAAPDAPLVEGLDLLRAEVDFAVRAEGALTLEDVLDRRTRLGLVPRDVERTRETVQAIVGDALSDGY